MIVALRGRTPVRWRHIHTPHGTGSWALLDGNTVTVRTPNGNKSVWLGDAHPETLAKFLIWELACEREDSAA